MCAVWASFVGIIGYALVQLYNFLGALGVPFALGFAIILFTIIIKLVTFPLTQKQMNTSRAMQELQPEIQKLQKKYKGDRQALSKAQMELYKEAGVSPFSGCLPMLVQMPIWFALYQALYQQLGTLGGRPDWGDAGAWCCPDRSFLWLSDLSQPKDMSWLWPLPPSVGWLTALGMLVLPILTVVTQIIVQKMMTPPNPDPQQKTMNQMMTFMPLMFGFFSLTVPQGLVLYWVTSNLFSMAQQYWTLKRHKPRPLQFSGLVKDEEMIEASSSATDSSRPEAPARPKRLTDAAMSASATPNTPKRVRDARRKSKR